METPTTIYKEINMTPFAQFCYLRSKFILKINDIERESIEISGERTDENIEKITLLYKKALSIAVYDTEKVYIERHDIYCMLSDVVILNGFTEYKSVDSGKTFTRYAGYQRIDVKRIIDPYMSNLPNTGDTIELTQTQPPKAL